METKDKKQTEIKEKKQYEFFVPFSNEPEIKPLEWSEFEDIWEYSSKEENIVNTGQKRNLQVEIDSYKDQTLIYNILDKYIGINNNPEMISQIPELNKKEGFYADISKMPNNVHDLKKLSELAKQKLEELQQQQESKVSNNEVNQKDNKENNTTNEKLSSIQESKSDNQTNKESR